MSRQEKKYTKMISLVMTPDDFLKMKKVSAYCKLSQSALVRELINEKFDEINEKKKPSKSKKD